MSRPRPGRSIPKSIRTAVIERDGMSCRRCGRPVVRPEHGVYRPDALHLDHVVEWAAGGKHEVDNLIVSCAECNLSRPRPTRDRIVRTHNGMTYFNAIVSMELREPGLEVLDQAVEDLADFHPAISIGSRGHAEVTITLPADSLRQATFTACAVVSVAFGEEPVSCSVMTTTEFDARQGFVPLPELVSVSEAAELLGISRQRVLQKIVAHQLPAIRVGRDYAIPRLAVTVTPADG